MASAVLSVAEAALELDDAVDESSGEKTGILSGRKATHWSYKLFIAGSIIGAIAAVACYVIGMQGGAVAGAFLAITNGFAAYYVKKFGILKTLEDYTAKLAKKVNDLKEVNEGLAQVNDGLQEVPKNWRSEIQQGKKEIERKTIELEKVSEKLQATEKKLLKLAGMTTDIQTKTYELSKAAVKFSEENKEFGERVKRLTKGVREVEEYSTDLKGLILETGSNTDNYEMLNQQFTKQLEMLDDLFGLMKDLYFSAQKRMRDLEAQVDKLGEVIPKAVRSADDAAQVRREMEQMRSEFGQLLDQLEKALDKVERYKKYKEGYNELRELKKSQKWPDIERLLKS